MGFPQVIEEDFQRIDAALKELLAKSEADASLLVEKAGHLIQQAGEQSTFPPDVLATLASNSFNAVQFMAGLLNEDKFPGLYQQGERNSTLMLNVDENCMLLVIFKAQISVGAVRYYAVETAKTIARQLEIAQQRQPSVSFDLTDLNVTDVQGLFRRKEAEATAAAAPDPLPTEAPAPPEPTPMPAPAAAEPPEPATPLPPVMAKRGPYIITVVPGSVWWCSCGRSQTQPFCDGSHKGTGLKPLQVDSGEDRRVAFCGCKATKNPPYCDGSHSKL
jgi:CDGSH-type Zn-finger protein/predicted regulator of Ras-like GTPase activity (Roadblock/LC7/MglB family)